ncbi:MAG: hypothetical protein LRY38_08900 [Aeromonadaceae bacterium]|nr:hypothetical protein [Aeromonadaceae bacterium]
MTHLLDKGIAAGRAHIPGATVEHGVFKMAAPGRLAPIEVGQQLAALLMIKAHVKQRRPLFPALEGGGDVLQYHLGPVAAEQPGYVFVLKLRVKRVDKVIRIRCQGCHQLLGLLALILFRRLIVAEQLVVEAQQGEAALEGLAVALPVIGELATGADEGDAHWPLLP